MTNRRLTRITGSAVLLCLVLAGFLNARWVAYLFHLAAHQAGVIFFKQDIRQILARSDTNVELRRKLELTLKIRSFVEERFSLTNSRSYTTLYDLRRDYLGYNITVAAEFSLEPEAFSFWPIGSFQYLGFFDKGRAESWAEIYRRRGFEVHLSEIGGYSTLGWFQDPLFSTQLDWSDFALARLIGHEIAHEKLYMKGDTEFNEMLASFIERKIAKDFAIANGADAALFSSARQQLNRQIVKEFFDRVSETREQLQSIYAGKFPPEQKRQAKAAELARLQLWLKKNQLRIRFIPAADELLKLPSLNNAVLAQFHRYHPQSAAFERSYTDCRQDYICWFTNLQQLEKCTASQRHEWVKLPAAQYRVPADFCAS